MPENASAKKVKDIYIVPPSLSSSKTELFPDYFGPGPFTIGRVDRQKHTCSDCFPLCLADECMLRVNVTYPRNFLDGNLANQPPFPLAVISGGFMIDSKQYVSYTERLASWGYVVVSYDIVQSFMSVRSDMLIRCFITDIINWVEQNDALGEIADTSKVYLVGHSRGGKVSVLAASHDPRVVAVCLLDPVDNTVYAPLAPGFPSAVDTLKTAGRDSLRDNVEASPPAEDNALLKQSEVLEVNWEGPAIPIAIVGAGRGADCAPTEANYRNFFGAAPPPVWELEMENAGHFQYVDGASGIQRGVCTEGRASFEDVHNVSFGVMVAWAELMVKRRCAQETDATLVEAKQINNNITSPSPSQVIETVGSSALSRSRIPEDELKRIEEVVKDIYIASQKFGAYTIINSKFKSA
mmetsp:Transcript_24282/g.33438  ORF Transcript_24282/g.33438 Transcript_24282/m.33438 type:complete len:409 (-) Transcript_24282:7-1233(-)